MTRTEGGHSKIDELFSLEDEVVVVTGASSGLGQATAEIAAAAGAHVALIGRDRTRLQQVRGGIGADGGKAEAFVADVADGEAIGTVVAEIADSMGPIDVMVANAGIGAGPPYRFPGGGIAEFPLDTWDQVLATNLTGTFHTLRAAAPLMPDGGRMVVTSSTAGLRSDPMVGYAYLASKAATLNLVKQLALEMAPRGIRVNALAPGPFHTRIGGDQRMPPEIERIWEGTIALRRVGEPHELRGAALLLMSHASSFMTGATVAVDGGALALSHTEF